MKWFECGSCLAEFRVVSDSDDSVAFCPYCGDEVEDEDTDEEEDDDYDA